jgi:hypothetical protein
VCVCVCVRARQTKRSQAVRLVTATLCINVSLMSDFCAPLCWSLNLNIIIKLC